MHGILDLYLLDLYLLDLYKFSLIKLFCLHSLVATMTQLRTCVIQIVTLKGGT